MKYFFIEDIMNYELLHKFVAFANASENEPWTILLNSDGGRESVELVILNAINTHKHSVTVVGMYLMSAAFDLFYHAKCKRQLTNGCMGMYHMAYNELQINVNGRPSYTSGEAMMKRNKETGHAKALDFATEFMTPLELKKFKKGDDVYFTFKRLKEIFPDVTII